MDKIALSENDKSAFISCFVAGYIVHLFVFTNIIPNSDGLSRIVDPQQMTISGRWFLHYATSFNGFLQAPSVIAFFSVLFMSLAALLMVRILGIESRIFSALTGIILIVFPPAAFTYLYMFTASAYFFGILLAVAGVRITQKWKYGFIPAALILACSIGTYQAYLAVAGALSLMCIVLQSLREEESVRSILFSALRHLIFLVLGLLLYLLILRGFLWAKGLTLIDYHGISSMGDKMKPGALLSLLGPAYRRFFSYFFRPGGVSAFTNPFIAFLNIVVFLYSLLSILVMLKTQKAKKHPGIYSMIAAALLLLPPAMNLAVFMDDTKEIMRYALVLMYVFTTALAERVLFPDKQMAQAKCCGERSLLHHAAAGILIAVFLLLDGCFFQVDNKAYTAAATAHRASETFAANLVSRVEMTPGYHSGMEVIIIGSFPNSVYYNGLDELQLAGAPVDSVLPLSKHIYYYLNDWLNVPWQEPAEEMMKTVSDSEVFRKMPLYPDDGSVGIIDGRVIVRLADHYTPKNEYEIQYDQRR